MPDVNVQSKLVPSVGFAAKLPAVTLIIAFNTAFSLSVNAVGTVPANEPEPMATDVTPTLTVSVRSMSVTVMLLIAVSLVSVSVRLTVSAPLLIDSVSFVPVIVTVTVEVVAELLSLPVAPLLSAALMV